MFLVVWFNKSIVTQRITSRHAKSSTHILKSKNVRTKIHISVPVITLCSLNI